MSLTRLRVEVTAVPDRTRGADLKEFDDLFDGRFCRDEVEARGPVVRGLAVEAPRSFRDIDGRRIPEIGLVPDHPFRALRMRLQGHLGDVEG